MTVKSRLISIQLAIVLSALCLCQCHFEGPAHEAPMCKTIDEIEKSTGKECIVLGRYAIKTFYGKKNTVIAEWPVVVVNHKLEVMIGSLWKEEERRDPLEIQRLSGKKVIVRGLVHTEPPGSIQNFSHPCISPVDSIVPAEK